MTVGKSGCIVIEIDSELKKELYQSLGNENSSLKKWFLTNVQGNLSGKSQVPISFESEDSGQISEVSS